MFTGKELKLQRITNDITAKELAEQLNISNSYLCKLEKEVQSIPSHIYEKWIDKLNVN